MLPALVVGKVNYALSAVMFINIAIVPGDFDSSPGMTGVCFIFRYAKRKDVQVDRSGDLACILNIAIPRICRKDLNFNPVIVMTGLRIKQLRNY